MKRSKSPPVILISDHRRFPALWVPYEVFEMGLSSRALQTYESLSYYAGGTASCSVPIKQMAKRVAVSEDTIKRGLKELIDRKLVRVERIYKQNGSKASREQLANHYHLMDLSKRKIVPI